jgi:hypothetical protein
MSEIEELREQVDDLKRQLQSSKDLSRMYLQRRANGHPNRESLSYSRMKARAPYFGLSKRSGFYQLFRLRKHSSFTDTTKRL